MLTIWPWLNHIHATNTGKCPERCYNLMPLNRRCLNTCLYIDSDVTFGSLWFQSPLLKYMSIKWYLFALFIFWLMGGEGCITYKTKFRRVDLSLRLYIIDGSYHHWFAWPSVAYECLFSHVHSFGVYTKWFNRHLYRYKNIIKSYHWKLQQNIQVASMLTVSKMLRMKKCLPQ